jgi:hypothetical protein
MSAFEHSWLMTGNPSPILVMEELPTTRSGYDRRERRFSVQLVLPSNCPPEMFRLSGMPIKIKDRPFKFATRL